MIRTIGVLPDMAEVNEKVEDEDDSLAAFSRNVEMGVITSVAALRKAEKQYRTNPGNDVVSFARGTSYEELALKIKPDADGKWAHPLHIFRTYHQTTIGSDNLSRKVHDFLVQQGRKKGQRMDILSVESGISGARLRAVFLVRIYEHMPDMRLLFPYLGVAPEKREKKKKDKFIIPDGAIRTYSEEEKASYAKSRADQEAVVKAMDPAVPYLNMLDTYVPSKLEEVDPSQEFTYDLETKDMQVSTLIGYREFIKIFQEVMQYVTSVERDTYYSVIRGVKPKKEFDEVLSIYVDKDYVSPGLLPPEDKPALMAKLNRALFELYIVQDLIDDPDITDIKITSPDTIRVRVKGRAYLSNITFIGDEDYERFITALSIRNNVDLKLPTQTFTDDHDMNYILRFTITAPYITGSGVPIIHIRKVSRKKMLSADLIKAGMFDEKIRDYLIDRGRNSDKGVVFAGPPGSGKTVALNWFLEEAYESSAEILVIQESDELFAYRKGVMFEHVVLNPQKGEKACTLEDLGQMALVSGANVFIIGEAKGGEICSAITLSNSGCRTAMTVHSPSSTETIDKMADLAMRGIAQSYEQAKRMMTSFGTIVYLQDFKITEISEITGYDDKKGIQYRAVYRIPENKRKEKDI